MITLSINSTIISSQNTKNSEIGNGNESFLSKLIISKEESNSSKTSALTYENIKGISLDEIENLFTNENDKLMAKNLRLATLFSNDDYLSKAMFDTVSGQAFDLGYSFLSDRYEDKSIFLNSKNSDNLFDLLQESISSKINNSDTKSTNVISQDKLDEILTQVNSFNFVSALSNSSKKAYDKYKDDENDYSYLYNDYNLKYQELVYKYQELENINKTLIKQF
ncbi:MAG: hypothetical protein RBR65_08675 [Aliarcobacter sp.]|jgi:hypothetical protein|nr:hypothetical protein [Aliarcobacter sp.]